jgi:hypothetical protein
MHTFRVTGADAKVAADFKTVWNQFKATRDSGDLQR